MLSLRLALLAALFLVSSTARADGYTLRAELDTHTHVVRGTERIVFTNRSARALDHLVFHLYMNAFNGDANVFMRESRGQLRGVRRTNHGNIRVLSMRAGGHDLLRGANMEIVPDDRTQMRVRLPAPLAPGETITLDVRFVTTLPKVFARAGYEGEFHMVAQWFPKLAKLEPDGRFESFPYHGDGEFYADFTNYHLTIVVAPAITIGASGRLVSRRSLPSGHIERVYIADRVHDVAFVASRSLSTLERTCARVNVHTLHAPGYEDAARDHTDETCRALGWLGARYGDYPYTDLTVVVPPRGADGASGMEYPTLFLTAGPWFDGEMFGIDEARETTTHELVHQWFQGLVATNEVQYPFLDEGITSFVTSDYHVSYDPEAADVRSEALRRFSSPRGAPPPGGHVRTFVRGHYGARVYLRSELILETVARTWGRERVRAALGRYARAHRFGHPTPTDLFEVFDATFHEGFSARVLDPLFMKGETVTTRAFVEGTGLVAELRGLRTIPIDVLHVSPEGVRTHTHLGARERVVFGPGCVTIDPYRRNMLDPRRTDDRVCTPASRRRTSYVERLTALLAAFVVSAP